LDSLEYIEAYFNEQLSPEEKTAFEKKIEADPLFAEEVGFYLSSKQVIATAATEQRERFKTTYETYKQDIQSQKQSPGVVRKMWPWAAAAAILAGIILGWYAWFQPTSPHALADRYIKENFQTLAVTMGNKEDSLQAGLRLFNANRLEEALHQFETLAQRDSSFYDAKKYAGIVSVRLAQYDKAIDYFQQLENYSPLYANPGKFFHALALMKRNQPGDLETARQLLQDVVKNDMEESNIAAKWLEKW
jgi:tetratricopeptide (TPR) repeat protein